MTKKKAPSAKAAKLIAGAKAKLQTGMQLSTELHSMVVDVLAHNDSAAWGEIVSVDSVLAELRSAGVRANRYKLEQYAIQRLGRVSWSKP